MIRGITIPMPENDIQRVNGLLAGFPATWPGRFGNASYKITVRSWGQVAVSVSRFVLDGFQLPVLDRVDCGQIRFWKSSPKQDDSIRSD